MSKDWFNKLNEQDKNYIRFLVIFIIIFLFTLALAIVLGTISFDIVLIITIGSILIASTILIN